MSDIRPEPLVNGKPLSSLRVVDLKQELEKRGISKSGTKKDLMDKLRTRLELESMQMQTAQSVDSGGEHVPNLSLKDGEPNDYVKAYLVEQQNLIRQQVIPDATTAGETTEVVAAAAAAAPPTDEPAAEQAQDLSPKKQIRATRSPRTSESSPQSTGRRSLRSASGTVASEGEESEVAEPVVPQAEDQMEKMPAVESEASATSLPVDQQSAATGSPATCVSKEDEARLSVPPEKPQLPAKETTSETAADVPAEPEVKTQVADSTDHSHREDGHETEAAPVQSQAPLVAEPVVEATPAASDAAETVTKGQESESSEADPQTAGKEPEETEADAEAMDVADEKAESCATSETVDGGGDGPPHEKSPIQSMETSCPEPKVEEKVAKAEADGKEGVKEEAAGDEVGKEKEVDESVREKSDRRRLVVEKKEEVGDETKAKPKRKWGTSGSERQINRGISSSQLNSLLPKKEKVSPGSQEEVQAGDSESITMSGKPFSQPANGSLGASHRLPADQQQQEHHIQENELDSKPVNGQSVSPEETKSASELEAARNPVSNVLFVENLTRPFTLPALHALLKTHGTIDTDKFWIDKIKSMCMVAYATVEEAEAARKGLHGTRWPQSNPKTLVVDFATEAEIESRKKEAEKPVIVQQTASTRTSDKYDITIRKTIGDEKEGSNKAVRDWDRDKVSESSPPTKRSRRSPSPVRRNDDKQDGSRKSPEPECPAKLLDDLFKKTSSSPIIYWLPLNDEEAENRAKQREERNKKRQEERAAREALRQNRRTPPPPPVRSARSPPTSGRSARGAAGDRSYNRNSRSRSRSPVRHGARYRSPMRRSPPRRR